MVPFDNGWVVADINVGILYLFAMSSLGVYGIIMARLGVELEILRSCRRLRSAAQMVSYEVSIGFVIITVLLFAGSLNLSDHRARAGQTSAGSSSPSCSRCCVIFFVSALAETNRPPFDLLEAESELVAGFFVEYSSTPFLLFFLGEYVNIVLMCAMMRDPVPRRLAAAVQHLAAQRWCRASSGSCSRSCFFFFMFAMVKAIVPRYRYDQLMRLGWKVFLPTSLLWVVVTAGWVLVFHHHA